MTSCRPIQSVIILVINKSDSRCAVVRFCYHSYDYRLNWTPLSPITITNSQFCNAVYVGSILNVVNVSKKLYVVFSVWFYNIDRTLRAL